MIVLYVCRNKDWKMASLVVSRAVILTGSDFDPRGHIAVSGHTFCCPKCGDSVLMAPGE